MKKHKVDFYKESILPSCNSPEPSWRNYIYAIPCNGKFIVYQPLKKLAFIANKSLVSFIESFLNDGISDADSGNSEVLKFLDSLSFFSDPGFSSKPAYSPEIYKPSIAVLLLTTSCNFHCTYCYASSGNKKGNVMTPETGFAAIDLVCNNAGESGETFFSLNFHGGGEPIVAWSEFCKLVQYARTKSVPARISLATNGYCSKQKLDWLLGNVDEFSLSCDGIAEIQNKQRPSKSGRDTFDTVFRTIRALDKHSKPYGIRLTVTESGVDALPRSIEFFCKETGCGSFQAEPAFDHGRARENGIALVNQKRFVSSFLSAYDIAAHHHRKLFYSGARPGILTSTFCQAPFNALIVSNKGLLTTCYEVFDPALELGELFFIGALQPDSTLTINEVKRRKLIERIEERQHLCRDCFCFWHCAGDCPAKTVTPEGNEHLVAGIRCEMNREITKALLLRYIHESGGIWTGNIN